MNSYELNKLKADAKILQDQFKLGFSDALKLSVEIWKAKSLDEIAHFLRKDGEFQESMSQIVNAINERI